MAAPALLEDADFVSVGTNDLMQFLFAADRGTPALAGRYDLLSPAVIDLLDTLQAAAAAAGVPVSVCGEAGARPLDAMVLAALGITTLSMPASALLPMKGFMAELDLARSAPCWRRPGASAGSSASPAGADHAAGRASTVCRSEAGPVRRHGRPVRSPARPLAGCTWPVVEATVMIASGRVADMALRA